MGGCGICRRCCKDCFCGRGWYKMEDNTATGAPAAAITHRSLQGLGSGECLACVDSTVVIGISTI